MPYSVKVRYNPRAQVIIGIGYTVVTQVITCSFLLQAHVEESTHAIEWATLKWYRVTLPRYRVIRYNFRPT